MNMNSTTMDTNIGLMAEQVRRLVQTNPDITELHLFADCSGSAGPWDHHAPVTALIDTARELNLGVLFSSFSHYCSGPAPVGPLTKSTNALWDELLRIPRVSGGTDFWVVWDVIQSPYQAPHQTNRLNLIVTDFEWLPPATPPKAGHPANLYYTPCYPRRSVESVRKSAAVFADSMLKNNIEPDIRQRVLGLTH